MPVCTDCHPGHTEEGTTALARRIRLGHPCMGCHGDEALMQKYGISTNVVSTYLSDFHGVSVKFYEQRRGRLQAQAPGLFRLPRHPRRGRDLR